MPEDSRRETSPADAEHYPPYVATEEERRRWNLALGVARLLFDTAPDVWQATRAIYRSPIETGSD